MDVERARALLAAERDEVQKLLAETEQSGREDRETEDEQDADVDDPAQSLTQQGMDDAIAESLRDRLGALERAEQRLADGTYGRSVQSGQPIPDARLEADPAAELTVEEAAAQEAADQVGPGLARGSVEVRRQAEPLEQAGVGSQEVMDVRDLAAGDLRDLDAPGHQARPVAVRLVLAERG